MAETRIEVDDGKRVVILRDDRAAEKLSCGISRGIPNNLEYLLACEVRELRAKLAGPANLGEMPTPELLRRLAEIKAEEKAINTVLWDRADA